MIVYEWQTIIDLKTNTVISSSDLNDMQQKGSYIQVKHEFYGHDQNQLIVKMEDEQNSYDSFSYQKPENLRKKIKKEKKKEKKLQSKRQIRNIKYINCIEKFMGENEQKVQVDKEIQRIERRKYHTLELKNSKNIIRTFQRAIYDFMLRNYERCEKILGFSLLQIKAQRRELTGNLQSLKEVKALWVHDLDSPIQEQNINKCIRIMTLSFLRNEAMQYFSRFEDIKRLLKYRNWLINYLSNPDEFSNLIVWTQSEEEEQDKVLEEKKLQKLLKQSREK